MLFERRELNPAHFLLSFPFRHAREMEAMTSGSDTDFENSFVVSGLSEFDVSEIEAIASIPKEREIVALISPVIVYFRRRNESDGRSGGREARRRA